MGAVWREYLASISVFGTMWGGHIVVDEAGALLALVVLTI